MAMGLLNQKTKQLENWSIDSAGIWAINGEPPAKNSQLAVEMFGGNIRDHRSQAITGELLTQFDLIFTMEANQKEALQIEFPTISDRVYLISELVNDFFDIEDPIGGSINDYYLTATKLNFIIDTGWNNLLALLKQDKR